MSIIGAYFYYTYDKKIKKYIAVFISIMGLIMANDTENKKAVFAAGVFGE